MRMHLKVEGKEYYYTYDFYRIDDRRIMVSLYRSDEGGNKIESLGEVSDYYITTFAFKKLVNQYIGILNGEDVDESLSYTWEDEKTGRLLWKTHKNVKKNAPNPSLSKNIQKKYYFLKKGLHFIK